MSIKTHSVVQGVNLKLFIHLIKYVLLVRISFLVYRVFRLRRLRVTQQRPLRVTALKGFEVL